MYRRYFKNNIGRYIFNSLQKISRKYNNLYILKISKMHREIERRSSNCSHRSRSSQKDGYDNIIEEFEGRVPRYEDIVYVMSIESEKKSNRGSDLLAKLDQQTSFKIKLRTSDSLNNNANRTEVNPNEIQNIPLRLLEDPIECQIPNRGEQELSPLSHSCQCYKKCQGNQCCCYLFIEPCQQDKCCIGCIQLKNKLLGIKLQPQVFIQTTCTCKKTKCLKHYCECFSKNRFCSPKCSCEDCMNTENSEPYGKFRIEPINYNSIEEKGCNCKKIKCEKKYCKCFANGQKCTKFCICENCNNMDEELKILRRKINENNQMQEQFNLAPLQQLPTEMEFEQPDFSKFNLQ